MMKPGLTARPEVSWAVNEAYSIFAICNKRRGKILLQGCNPPFQLEYITLDEFEKAFDIVNPTTDKKHLFRILDSMDEAYINHPRKIPKPIERKPRR